MAQNATPSGMKQLICNCDERGEVGRCVHAIPFYPIGDCTSRGREAGAPFPGIDDSATALASGSYGIDSRLEASYNQAEVI